MSEEKATYLFDHVLDGFESSHKGIEQLREKDLISDEEYKDLLRKNIARLIDRVKEFKIAQRLTCIAFAALFTWMQIGCEDLDMRRSSRLRLRRKNKNELTI